MSSLDKDVQASEPIIPEGILVSPTLATPDILPVATNTNIAHDPYQALRFRDFRLYFFGTLIATIGQKMLEVALGWELYERTGSALVLGGVGLMLVIPVILLSLPAGHVADHFNRKHIVLITQIVMVVCSLGLTALSFTHGPILFIYVCLFIMGTASAFSSPANSTLLAQTIPNSAYENGATWNSSSWQLASVFGPTLGGVLVALLHSATPVYLFDAAGALTFVLLVALMRSRPQPARQHNTEKVSLHSLLEGISFLRAAPVLLAAITLDLFAVLLGGATTLLPIFSKDILQVGPTGLGWLRAAPSVGAVCVALLLTHRPPFKKAGRTLLLAVAGFGVATIIFGLSRSFWLSLLMLFALGGLDNISVVIRGTLMLTRAPDEMRGRISAVNSVFIGASNELGGFESGLTAQFFGPITSVVAGGIGTLLVVLLVALYWPEMRRLSKIRESAEL